MPRRVARLSPQGAIATTTGPERPGIALEHTVATDGVE